MPPGDSLHFTTVAGSHSAATGDGRLDLTGCVRGTLPRWLPGTAARDGVSASVLVAALAGARSASGNLSSRGITAAGVISGTSTSAIRALQTSTTLLTTITTTAMAADSTGATVLGLRDTQAIPEPSLPSPATR